MKKAILSEQHLELLREKIRPYISEKRYGHVLAVEEEAAALGALLLSGEIPRLRAAALLHDITKRCTAEEHLALAQALGIADLDGEELPTYHAVTGAALARRDFPDETDSEICTAIARHTTGAAEMTLFDAIIYLADYIEKTRTFEDCVCLRSFFYDGKERTGDALLEHFRKTMILSFDMTIRSLLADGRRIHPDTVKARNAFLTKSVL